jgi:hypothetical protein
MTSVRKIKVFFKISPPRLNRQALENAATGHRRSINAAKIRANGANVTTHRGLVKANEALIVTDA